MNSPKWQQLPNELIETIFKNADPADKPLCAAICRTSKTGMRAMYGLNEKGKSMGPSIMYHSSGITDLTWSAKERVGRLNLFMRTILDRPDLAGKVIELKVITRFHSSTESEDDIPDESKLKQKLHHMNLPDPFINQALLRLEHHDYRYEEVYLWRHVVLVCTNLTSVEVYDPMHRYDVLYSLGRLYEGLEYARKKDTSPHSKLGRCGLDSIQVIALGQRHKDDPCHAFQFNADYKSLGLNLPALRSLTIHNMARWNCDNRLIESAVEHIALINCSPEVICPNEPNEWLLAYLPALKKLQVTLKGRWESQAYLTSHILAVQLNLITTLEDLSITSNDTVESEYDSDDWSEASSECSDMSCLNDCDKSHSHDGSPYDGDNPDPDKPYYSEEDSEYSRGLLQGHQLGVDTFRHSLKTLVNLKKLTLPLAACFADCSTPAYGHPKRVQSNFVEFLLNMLPDDVSQLEMEIISPNRHLSAEDDAFLVSAACKQFKSLTIYNRTKESWIASREKAAKDLAEVQAFAVLI